MALRVFAYQGVMASRAMQVQETSSPPQVHGIGARTVEGTRAAIAADPVLSGLVSVGVG